MSFLQIRKLAYKLEKLVFSFELNNSTVQVMPEP